MQTKNITEQEELPFEFKNNVVSNKNVHKFRVNSRKNKIL